MRPGVYDYRRLYACLKAVNNGAGTVYQVSRRVRKTIRDYETVVHIVSEAIRAGLLKQLENRCRERRASPYILELTQDGQRVLWAFTPLRKMILE